MPYDGKNWPQNPVAKGLYGAANIIRKNGWVQRDWGDTGSPRCIMGAISEISWKIDCIAPFTSCRNALIEYIGEENPVDWNNTPGRTKEEVIEALEGAAAMVEAKETVS